MKETPSILFYGKARVGEAVVALSKSLGIDIVQKDDSDAEFDAAEYLAVIPSPGVPPTNRAHSGGNVLSELDFAHRYLPKGFKIVSVTGTDGKSTTAWILFELFRREFGDDRVFLSGNFEIPFSQTVRQIREKGLKRGVIVIECSSFMLHDVGSARSLEMLEKLPKGEREGGFKTDHSIFTNLESDHLNWHADLAEYLRDKLALARLTTGTAAVNAQVPARAASWGVKFEALPQMRFFGTSTELRDRTDGHDITVTGRKKYRLEETRFSGLHNALNVLSVAVVGNAMKICSKRTKTYLKDIGGLAHRLEFVVEKNGVRYVDDSKSTSCQSLKAALGAFKPASVRLIAGGSDKGDPFEGLENPLSEKVAFAALIGATAAQLAGICEKAGVPHRVCKDMDQAVTAASEGASSGQTVLL
ncbi:MAG: UDP-N-acetylmuramoyl-L-alanine--D-glutamate ligase, partial [Patescibacteria group bacterium]